jgi:hypothetical protein
LQALALRVTSGYLHFKFPLHAQSEKQ